MKNIFNTNQQRKKQLINKLLLVIVILLVMTFIVNPLVIYILVKCASLILGKHLFYSYWEYVFFGVGLAVMINLIKKIFTKGK